MNWRFFSVATVSLLGVACTGPKPPATFDGGGVLETGASDTGVRDTGAPDTGSPVDTGAPVDTGTAPDVPTDTVGPPDAPDAGPPGAAWCDLPVPSTANVPGVNIPEGFCLRRFARVPTPRVIRFAPNGDLFVASPSTGTPGGAPLGRGAILTLVDDNRDGVADSTDMATVTFLDRVDSVHGLLFPRAGGTLMYTVDDTVYRMPYAVGDRRATVPQRMHEVIAEMTDFARWTHTLAEAVDGSLFVSMGQYDIAQCPAPNRRQGAVLRIGAGQPRNGAIWVDGFRNPMYLRCMPWGACYAAELTGDGWGSIGGREKLVELRQGDTYGFPCCVDRAMPVPGSGQSCTNVAPSVQSYPLGDTPFGFDWAPSSWPAPTPGRSSWASTGWWARGRTPRWRGLPLIR